MPRGRRKGKGKGGLDHPVDTVMGDLEKPLYQGDDEVPLLPPSRGLSSMEAERLLDHHGRNELPHRKTPGWLIFLRCLWGPMPIAIWIAVTIEFLLGNFPDGGVLLLIQFANALIVWYETTKAGDAVAALRSSLKPLATVMRDGMWQNIDAALLVPGDIVKLAAGSAVPADCTINEGTIDVDEAALTGESLPVTMGVESMPKMGSTVVRGEVDGTVQFTGQKTFFGKTALLLQSVETDLGNIHYVLVRVMFVLTTLSLLLCITCFGYLMGNYKMKFRDSLEFAVVLFVVSIPIALEVVVTTTLALGSEELSKKNVIVTRLSSIEMMAAVNMLCSDKTGTLTMNKMEIQEECHVFSKEYNRENLLVLAALAAKWREPPRDALDTMVLGVADLDECDKYTQLEFVPFDPRIRRTEATLRGPDGLVFKVTKGAPNVVLQVVHNRDVIKSEVESIVEDLGRRGIRCLTVARTKEDQQWHLAGILTFLDPPRPDTKETVRRSKEYGVDVKIITGDHQLIAKEMARVLDMDTNILTAEGLPRFPESGDPKDIPTTLGETHGDMILACGGFAHVYPEHKYLILEALRQRGYTVAMTGDGVNDAPTLKRADVGVAVDGATDAARSASDMVLTEPGLSAVVDAMLIARGVFQRMLSFLTYRISATLQLVFFFFIGVFALPCQHYGIDNVDFRFFRIPAFLFMVITLLNDGILMTIGYDRVIPEQRPQRWNLPVVFTVASALGFVACASSLLLLWMGLDSHDDYSWFSYLGIPPVSEGQIVTMLYLKVSISDFLTLFSARTAPNWFWSSCPSPVLVIGALLSLTISSCLAAFFPDREVGKTPIVGLAHGHTLSHRLLPLWVWIWCIGWWLVQEIVKVLTCKFMERFDLFSYRTIAEGKWVPTAKTTMRHRSHGISLGATDNVEQPLVS